MLIIYSQAVRLPTRTGDNNLKNNHRIKLIAASLALTTSLSAVGGLGGLNVQSNLGEPFSGTVTVTGEEAKVLLNGGNASLSDSNLRTSVRKSGDKAVINIRSNTPINDPVLVFQVGVGSQSRQYTAIIDPADYAAGSAAASQGENRSAAVDQSASERTVSPRSAQQKPSIKQAQEQAKIRKENKKSNAYSKVERSRDAASAEQKSFVPLEGNYKVRHGETLTFIAEKVRPQGLTLSETINALVLANPKVFPDNNPDIVIAGSTLSIPSAAELRSLSKQGVAAVKKTEETVVETPAQTAQASQPAVSVEAPGEAEKTSESQTTASVTPAASEPVVTKAEEEKASAPAAVATENTPKSEAVPSTKPAVAETENSGWWRWLLFAGLGAIALWLLLRLATKKKDHVEQADENDQILLKEAAEETHLHAQNLNSSASSTVVKPSESSLPHPGAVSGAAAATVAAATQTKTAEEGLDVEDDFDDEIFFTETETIPADKSENNFSLDLGSIDRAQDGIVSGALTQDEETQKRENANWDAIESTESVYEPEPENEYQHVAVEFTPVEDTAQSVEVVEIAEISSNEGKLEQSDEPDAVNIEFETENQDQVSTVQEADVSEISSQQDESVAVNTVEFEPLEFEASDSSEADKLALSESEPSTFDQVPADSAEVTETNSAESIVEFDNQVVESGSVEQITETYDATSFANQASDGQVGEAWITADADNSAIAFQDEELAKPVEVNVSDDDGETIEWESMELEGDSERSETGFISESVGMTAPLEAKYELAQMYVEIGDPDAARETLQELLEEANGSILEKTETMLAELNK
ncbi:FimV/HubP family polar landmark protein [Neisseria sp. 74A18]|uniref:FimV/HubP family polar landmark protein n=1 Tax=Neisseria sp. 74A18 TaxID=1696094 RepID=UPI0006CAF5BE|nr:FimV/HubP family polar landmark protein [Neisseria sp. 74A18]